MAFKQNEYISEYNKNKYKMYQFRVKRSDKELIDHLDGVGNKNSYIVSLIDNDFRRSVYTLKEIKKLIKPILNKHGISDIYIFGSYARGEANKESDVDIYCDKGDIRTLPEQVALEEELESALKKEVDIIFDTMTIDDYFKEQIFEDRIKLC